MIQLARLAWFAVVCYAGLCVSSATRNPLPGIEKRLRAIGLSTDEPTSKQRSIKQLLGIPETTGMHARSTTSLSPENKHIVDMFVKLQTDPRHDTLSLVDADTVRSFHANVSKLPNSLKTKLTFDLGRLSSDETLKKVELRFNPLDVFGDRENVKNIRFKLTLKNRRGNSKATQIFRSNPEELQSAGDYVVADLSSCVQSLQKSVGRVTEDTVLELVFRSLGKLKKQSDRSLNPGVFLVVYSNSPDFTQEFSHSVQKANRRRPKRSTRYRASQDECKSVRYLVDVQKIGWNNYILSPSIYRDNYCAGKCSARYLLSKKPPTLHAVAQSLMHEKDRTIPGLCCVPTKLRSQKFLIFDSNSRMVMKNFNNIVADQCGCR